MAEVKFEILRELNLSMDETPHIITFKGCIMDLEDEDKYDEDNIEVGCCDGFIYEIKRSVEDGADIQMQADGESGELIRYLTDALKSNLSIRAAVGVAAGLTEGVVPARFLVINYVEIFPGHRGKDLGLEVVTSIINTFGGGCSLVMLKAWPIQRKTSDQDYCKQRQLPAYSREADRKLMKHWAKIGFRRVARTQLMVRPSYNWYL